MNELKFVLFALVLAAPPLWLIQHTQATEHCMTNAQITQDVDDVMNDIITSVAKSRGRSVDQLKKLPEATLVKDEFEKSLKSVIIKMNRYCGY